MCVVKGWEVREIVFLSIPEIRKPIPSITHYKSHNHDKFTVVGKCIIAHPPPDWEEIEE